tara:strand:- start:1274 stop:2137 length:864 start_codon:yes stop_codon:yes gene_type:complete
MYTEWKEVNDKLIGTVTFDGVSDAIDRVVQSVQNGVGVSLANKDKVGTWFDDYHLDWLDNKSREDIKRLVERPDASAIAEVERIRQKISDEVVEYKQMITKRKRRRGCEHGDEIDVDRFLGGDMFCWERVEHTDVPRKSITIGCNVSIGCNRDREDLLSRGAAVCALAEHLTAEGYNVEVVAVLKSLNPWQRKQGSMVTSVMVKRMDMPLDVAAIVTAMAEISFARGILVGSIVTESKYKMSGGLGSPAEVTGREQKELGIDTLCPMDIYSQTRATEWVIDCINGLE